MRENKTNPLSWYKRLVSPELFASCSSFCLFVVAMPPRTVASPKKKKLKRKGSDASKSTLKKSRVAEPCSAPLVSLRLTDADAASSNAPRRSGRSTAGTGGRNSQLEKIGALLEAPSGTHKPKGSTSLGPNIPVNPQAPGPPRYKGRGNRSNVWCIVFLYIYVC